MRKNERRLSFFIYENFIGRVISLLSLSFFFLSWLSNFTFGIKILLGLLNH